MRKEPDAVEDRQPGRLIGIGLSPRAASRLASALAPEGGTPLAFVDGGTHREAALDDLRCTAEDVAVVAAVDAESLGRVRAFRREHPDVAVLGLVPRADVELEAALLGAGVHELAATPARLSAALRRARARAAASGKAPGPGANGPERTLDSFFPNLFDWAWVVGIAEDGTMSFETVNPPLEAGDGFLRPEFATRPVTECLPNAEGSRLVAHLERVLSDGLPLRYEEEQAVGRRTRAFQTILTPVRNKWGRIHRVAGVSRDVTALKEALEALRASEERLTHALQGTQQGLWDWDLATGRVFRSPRWFEMVGLAPGTVAETFEAGLRLIHPEDRRQLEAAMSAHLEGRTPRFQSEYRLRGRGGEWTWIFDAGKVVARDAGGHPARMAGTCTDITERRRAEEALRALVGGVVHEIRNPVYGIFINLDALEATFGVDPRYAPFVAALRESAERIASLMNDLRDYGEPRTLNPVPTPVRGLLENAARACSELAAGRACRVEVALEDAELLLPLNARRMHQVFRNLVENALQHAPAGTPVRVDGRRARVGGHEWWTFAVSDEGPGFDAEALSRAFEPFFTRREGGTGLGLSIVKRVVEEHGGTVEAENLAGGGARVTVRLPGAPHRTGILEGAGG